MAGAGKVDRDIFLPLEPLTISYVHSIGPYPLSGLTLGQVLDEACLECPDHEAFIISDTAERITFKQARDKALLYAKGLLSLGMTKGDVLCLSGMTSSDWIYLFFAAQYIGVVVSVAPQIPPYGNIFEFLSKTIKPKCVVIGPQKEHVIFQEVCDVLGVTEGNVSESSRVSSVKCVFSQSGMFSEDEVKTCRGIKSVVELESLGTIIDDEQLKDARDQVLQEDPVFMFPTSGSTGLPKFVCNNHRNLVNFGKFNFCMIEDIVSKEKPAIIASLNIWCDEMLAAVFIAVAIFHKDRVKCVSTPSDIRENTDALLKTLETEKCTHFIAWPAEYMGMIKSPNLAKYDLTSLRGAHLASQKCSKDLFDSLLKIFPSVLNIYGSSEAMAIACTTPSYDQDKRWNTVGSVRPFTEVKIIDDNGQIVPINKPGEICVKGWGIFWGYWNDPEKTANAITNGWFHSGDVGTMDEQGSLRIIGRKTDAIRFKRYAECVYPGPIEDTVKQHPYIADAKVIGVAKDYIGEELCLCVILKESKKLTKDELKRYCEEKLTLELWVPEHYIFMKDFPKTGARLKVSKNKLTEIVEEMLKMK